MNSYKIAVIVVWFGSFPSYFPAWLRSAEYNRDIDFFLFCDQPVVIASNNIHYIRTTLKDEVTRAATMLGETVHINTSYKYCDVRPFFGIVYQDFLKGYDFWGYCDIDLVFGKIRDFLTDEVLSSHERFYEWGHFSLFKNNDKMCHIYELPGALYTMEETLRGTIKVTSEEHYGLNRICERNQILWYRKYDFADFWVCFSDLQLWHGARNYDHQIFCWDSGRAFRAYIDENGKVQTNDYIYIHWQKRKPVIENGILSSDVIIITSKTIINTTSEDITAEKIIQLSPTMCKKDREKEKRTYIENKMKTFFWAPMNQKMLWIRQKVAYFKETGFLIQH